MRVDTALDGCWPWTGARFEPKPGYVYGVTTTRIGKKRILAHRLSVVISGRDLPDDMDVCHHCDNPICVRSDHLFVGTALDNMRDRDSKGRQAIGGGKYGTAKLTPQQAVEARRLYLTGAVGGYKQVGNVFGVDAKTIWQIVKGRAWNHAK